LIDEAIERRYIVRPRTPMEEVYRKVRQRCRELDIPDSRFRKPIGRPWLSVAIDVATRCVLGVHVGLEASDFPRPVKAILSSFSWYENRRAGQFEGTP
jgi:transposase InsO family protein